MKRISLSILAAGAAVAAFSAPAQATGEICPSNVAGNYGGQASDGTALLTDITSGQAVDCVGYVTGGIFNNSSADVPTVKAMLSTLGFADPNAINYSALYNNTGLKLSGLGGATSISFTGAPLLFGDTFVGIHWGGGSGGGRSALYKLHFDAPTSGFTILSQNLGGSSDAVLFGTQPAVPEPATWALMIMGMGAVGLSMRRRKTTVSFA